MAFAPFPARAPATAARGGDGGSRLRGSTASASEGTGTFALRSGRDRQMAVLLDAGGNEWLNRTALWLLGIAKCSCQLLSIAAQNGLVQVPPFGVGPSRNCFCCSNNRSKVQFDVLKSEYVFAPNEPREENDPVTGAEENMISNDLVHGEIVVAVEEGCCKNQDSRPRKPKAGTDWNLLCYWPRVVGRCPTKHLQGEQALTLLARCTKAGAFSGHTGVAAVAVVTAPVFAIVTAAAVAVVAVAVAETGYFVPQEEADLDTKCEANLTVYSFANKSICSAKLDSGYEREDEVLLKSAKKTLKYVRISQYFYEKGRYTKLSEKIVDSVKNIPEEPILLMKEKKKEKHAVNLAVALKLLNPNKTVGLLDTDIFGPSIPLMMNVQESPLLTKVDEKSPVVWRGLMVMSAIEKLLRQVDWGSLDYLIVDTPPGTGDTQLSLIQNIPISGVLLVTTPQKAALQVTQRGAVLFQKLEVPVVGIVENMSHVVCPNCQHSSSLYGHGTKDLASNLGISLLQEIPLDPAITKYTDSGKPVVIAEPDSVQAMAYKTLGRRVCEFLATQEMNSN
ncbi:Iron-sulfur protein NUBPL [Gryllus bimaculatus]|nr:Iron-sulfur protein NUBPL [Gryllus bimaculatus]